MSRPGGTVRSGAALSRRRAILAAALIAAAPVALLAALAAGSARIEPHQWWQVLLGGGTAAERDIVWALRAPRAAAAFVSGGLLAAAGTILQVLLRNPLADPYLLGISGGAAVGALLGMLVGTAVPLEAGAFAGAALAVALVFLIGRRGAGFEPYRLTLAGVAIASGAGAVVTLILSVAAPDQLHGMLFWLNGDLSGAADPGAPALVLAAGCALGMALGADFDALTLGPEKAATLGVAVVRTQWLATGCAVACTVAAVLLAGTLGFVGLVVPHLVRLAGFRRHVALLPLAVVAGGTLVTIADTVARTAAAPVELPAGAILALLGVPFLVALIARMR